MCVCMCLRERERDLCERKTSIGCLWYAPGPEIKPAISVCSEFDLKHQYFQEAKTTIKPIARTTTVTVGS